MNFDKISITYSKCLSVALFIQYAKRVRRVIFSSVGDMDPSNQPSRWRSW